jgi:hypothetical protein
VVVVVVGGCTGLGAETLEMLMDGNPSGDTRL